MEQLEKLWLSTGIYQLQFDQAAMIVIGLLLLYLAIVRKFEPLLLVPIGFGGILANIPGVDIAVGEGVRTRSADGQDNGSCRASR